MTRRREGCCFPCCCCSRWKLLLGDSSAAFDRQSILRRRREVSFLTGRKKKQKKHWNSKAFSSLSLSSQMSGRYLEEIIPRDKPGAGTGSSFGGGIGRGGGAASGGGRHAGFGGGGRSGAGRGMNRAPHRGGVDSNKKRKGNSGLEITFDPAAVRYAWEREEEERRGGRNDASPG